MVTVFARLWKTSSYFKMDFQTCEKINNSVCALVSVFRYDLFSPAIASDFFLDRVCFYDSW